MSEPEGPIPDASNNTTANNIVTGLETARTNQEPATQNKSDASQKGQNIEASRTQRIKDAFYIWFGKLRKAEPDRQAELIIALVIALFAIVQWHTVSVNNDTTTQQTNQIIAAARISAQAAKDNVIASRNFAQSANGINRGIEDAVEKLRIQASSAESMSQQASVQATAAQKQAEALESTAKIASQQLDSSERPWMRAEAGLYSTEPISFDLEGSVHVKILVAMQNIGHTPATRVQVNTALIATTQSETSIDYQQRKLCDDIRSISSWLGNGDTDFPLAPATGIVRYLTFPAFKIKSELLNPSNNRITTNNGANLVFEGDSDMNAGLAQTFIQTQGAKANPTLSVIGCVDYSAYNSLVRHQTTFLYELTGLDLGQRVIQEPALTKTSGIGNQAN